MPGCLHHFIRLDSTQSTHGPPAVFAGKHLILPSVIPHAGDHDDGSQATVMTCLHVFPSENGISPRSLMSQTNDTAFRCSGHAHPHRQLWRLPDHKTLGCKVMCLKTLGSLASSTEYSIAHPRLPYRRMHRQDQKFVESSIEGSERRLW
jgi:hypothetical protein